MIRAYLRLRPVFTRVLAGLDAVWSGFWLGVLDRDDFHAIDDAHYAATKRYRDDAHTARGLFDWEERAIGDHFPPAGRLLLLAAGGGRESYALTRRGFVVEGHECNPALVEYANAFLARAGADTTVHLLPRDEVPSGERTFDAVIVGWSGYMLIAGRDRRVALLRALRSRVADGAPILLSFFTRAPSTPRYRTITTLANALRRIRGRQAIEAGDDLAPNFLHRFTSEEIEAELADGGFAMTVYAPQGDGPFDSGYAVGVAMVLAIPADGALAASASPP
jgi:hypothetical protein